VQRLRQLNANPLGPYACSLLLPAYARFRRHLI
jgi:hypothetical protein